MSKSAIDFAFVKAEADFLAVLTHYGLKLSGSGVQRQALCPFHDDKRPSFKANLGRKAFHCFGCGAKGNVLGFVLRMEELEDKDIRKAARIVAEICGIPLTPPTGSPVNGQKRPKRRGSGPETIGKTVWAPIDAW
jgi:DNA primase